MAANTTANELNVTLQAQQDFQDSASQMAQINNSVANAGTNLVTSGMVTTAGQAFNQAVMAWSEDFQVIRNTLSTMAEQLGNTAQQLRASNQRNEELAASLPPSNL